MSKHIITCEHGAAFLQDKAHVVLSPSVNNARSVVPSAVFAHCESNVGPGPDGPCRPPWPAVDTALVAPETTGMIGMPVGQQYLGNAQLVLCKIVDQSGEPGSHPVGDCLV